MPTRICRRHGRGNPCTCAMGNLYRFLEPVLLLLLKQKGHSYGYDLSAELQGHALTDAEIERAALYRTLRRLETNGNVVSKWDVDEGGPGPPCLQADSKRRASPGGMGRCARSCRPVDGPLRPGRQAHSGQESPATPERLVCAGHSRPISRRRARRSALPPQHLMPLPCSAPLQRTAAQPGAGQPDQYR